MEVGRVDFFTITLLRNRPISKKDYISNRKKLKDNAKAITNPQFRLFLA